MAKTEAGITEADVKAAEAKLDDAREAVHAQRSLGSTPEGHAQATVEVPKAVLDKYKKAAAKLTEIRQAYRQQEEAAGRRTGLVAILDEASEGGEE